MALTDEQTQQIKERLLKQLSNFSRDKREQITQQVNTMTPNQIEDFIKQNQLTHLEGGQCIFCSIISGKTPSLRIAENEDSIAILEINPLSKGHTLIVPRKHSTKIEPSTQELAKEVKKKLQKKFSPKTIESKEVNIMGHPLIEIIPIYEDNGVQREKKQATEKELKALQKEILKDTTKSTKLKNGEDEQFASGKPKIKINLRNANCEQEENLRSPDHLLGGFLGKEPKPETTTSETKEKLFKILPRIPN